MNDDDRLERLLCAYEDAVMSTTDDELPTGAGSPEVTRILCGVLKGYGFQRDGSRLPASQRLRPAVRRRGQLRSQLRSPIAPELLRASFSAVSDEPGSNDVDDND